MYVTPIFFFKSNFRLTRDLDYTVVRAQRNYLPIGELFLSKNTRGKIYKHDVQKSRHDI